MPCVPQDSRHDGFIAPGCFEDDQRQLDPTQSLNELRVPGGIVCHLPQLSFAPDRDVETVLRYIDTDECVVLHFLPTTPFSEIAGVGPLLRYPSLRSCNRPGSTPEFRARRPQLPDGVSHRRVNDGLPS